MSGLNTIEKALISVLSNVSQGYLGGVHDAHDLVGRLVEGGIPQKKAQSAVISLARKGVIEFTVEPAGLGRQVIYRDENISEADIPRWIKLSGEISPYIHSIFSEVKNSAALKSDLEKEVIRAAEEGLGRQLSDIVSSYLIDIVSKDLEEIVQEQIKDPLEKELKAVVEKQRSLLESFSSKYLRVLKRILQTEFVEDYVNTFSSVYDELFAKYNSKMSTLGDLTSPERIKPEVLEYVRTNLSNGISINEDGEIVITAFSPEDLGYPEGPDSKETDRIKLFYFYAEGVIGDYAFVGRNIYALFHGGGVNKGYGRFGTGFLIERSIYEKRAVSVPELPRFGEVRAPFSGSAPSHIFDTVFSRIDMNKYFNAAAQAVCGG